jgi:hypothetical protein
VAVGVRFLVPVEFGESDGLNDREALPGTFFQIAIGVLAGEAVKEFPAGVAEPEERLAVFGDKETPVLAHLELRQLLVSRTYGRQAEVDENRKSEKEPKRSHHGASFPEVGRRSGG